MLQFFKLMLSILYLKLSLTPPQKIGTEFNDPHFIEDRSGIVQLFEWKWLDVARECEEFLALHGFGGVQVSPPNENVIISGRPWYERYQRELNKSYCFKYLPANSHNQIPADFLQTRNTVRFQRGLSQYDNEV